MLSLDSGGGREGMHLSLETVLLMHNNNVFLEPLEAYHTRALMSLDRDVHATMEKRWAAERLAFMAARGRAISNAFQALPVLRRAWEAATQPEVVQAGPEVVQPEVVARHGQVMT